MGFKTLPSGMEQAGLDRWAPRRFCKASNTWEEKGEGRKNRHSQLYMQAEKPVGDVGNLQSFYPPIISQLKQGQLSRRRWTVTQQLQIPVWLLISLQLTDVLEGSLCSKVPQCFFNKCF